jgi:CheY-like chemotaxis protein
MQSTIWVKVVGFSAVERHSINTLFRLSVNQTPSYSLWSPDAPASPDVSLIDLDCDQAEVEMASLSFDSDHKLIAVGSTPHNQASHSFQRPVDWNVLVQVLDDLFVSQISLDADTVHDDLGEVTTSTGARVTLLVGMKLEERLYLRARLSLAGLTDVDEADTAEQAGPFVSSRHYDVVIISLQVGDADPWSLVQAFTAMLSPPQAVIVATEMPSGSVMEQAQESGCLGMLDIPFNPPQVLGLLQQI